MASNPNNEVGGLPTERLRDMAEFIRDCVDESGTSGFYDNDALTLLEDLVKYLNETEPPLGDAITHGLVSFESVKGDKRGPLFLAGKQAFFIDSPNNATYPESGK